MKKYLPILTFLLLFLPAWQTCEKYIDIPTDSFVSISDTETVPLIQRIEQPNTFLSVFDGEQSFSGYELTWIPIASIKALIIEKDTDEFNFKEEITDIDTWTFVSFFPYTLVAFALVVLAFIKKKEKLFQYLSAINLCIIIVSYFLFLKISPDIFCIKYGFYLLIINSTLIFYSSFKTIKDEY
jgi:hypothetical protein